MCSNCIRMNKVPRFSFLISHNPLFSKIYFHIFLTAHLSYFRTIPISPLEISSSFSSALLYPVYEKFCFHFDFLLSYLVRIDSVFDFRFKAFALTFVSSLKGVNTCTAFTFSFATSTPYQKFHNLFAASSSSCAATKENCYHIPNFVCHS